MNKKDNGRVSILYYALITFSVFATIIVGVLSGDNKEFSFMFILPLGHSIAIFLAPNLFKDIKRNFVRLIIIGGYTVRNALTPLLIAIGGFHVTTIRIYETTAIAKAALLMSYETIVVFLFADYIVRRQQWHNSIVDSEENSKRLVKYFPKNTLFNLVTLLLTLLMIVAYVAVPTIKDAYQNLWRAETQVIIQKFSTIEQYSAGTLSRIFYAFFLMFFSVLQIIWSVYLIRSIKRIFGEKFISIVLSFGVLFLNTLFVSETSAYTVFVLVLLFMYMLLLYPSKNKIISGVSIAGAVIILFVMIIARTATYRVGSGNSLTSLATFINAYFPGIINVSVMWNVKVPSKLVSLYFDVYKGIPLQSLIPPLLSSGERLSNYFNYAAGTSAQILPFVGQTYFYLSFIGPAIQCIFIYFALKWEYKSHYENNYIKYMALITGGVIYASGCTMYDLTILCAFTFKTIIPFFILGWLTNIGVKYRK